MSTFLEETHSLNFNHPDFNEFLKGFNFSDNPTENAKEAYFKIRDLFLYDPYHLDLNKNALIASEIIKKRRAWCVEKALIMVACCRAIGIPARFGFAIVTNHIGVEKLTNYLRRHEIVFHGYVEVFLENKWIKCTPAFDKRVCRLSGVSTLDWDGKNDSMFQEFENGKKFMEYLNFYGEFADIPFELMHQEMKKYYPHLFATNFDSKEFSFKYDLDFSY
jgi:transglutaminase-like putative cysteine protease